MSIIVEYAKSPIWANEEKTAIDLIVKFSHISEEVPFTASFKDPERYGRELFEKAKSGLFGQIQDYIQPPPMPDQINTISVSMRQFRLALVEKGLLRDIESLVNSLGDSTAEQKIKIEWEYATTINRNNVWVNDLLTKMNMTNEQINDIFLVALTL
jgi:hypothetical protein